MYSQLNNLECVQTITIVHVCMKQNINQQKEGLPQAYLNLKGKEII